MQIFADLGAGRSESFKIDAGDVFFSATLEIFKSISKKIEIFLRNRSTGEHNIMQIIVYLINNNDKL